MKTFICRYAVWTWLALCLGLIGCSSAFAQNTVRQNEGAKPQTSCQPYSIAMSAVPCGSGYTGTKFPMRTKTCPDGHITEGLTFDTSNCKPAGTQTDPNATNCAITPSAVGCTPAPTLKGCDIGRHWTLAGSGIAHCVPDDFACPWSQTLSHDFLGNPFCVQNTCPLGQVLQGDGISCACPGGTVWNGSSCVVPCNSTTSYEAAACSFGTGTMFRALSIVCPSNTLSYGPWDTSSCFVPPPPTPSACNPSFGYEAAPCPSGFSGNAFRTAQVTCPSGATTYGSYDYSSCVSPSSPVGPGPVVSPPASPPSGGGQTSCSPSTSIDFSVCPSGFTGLQSRQLFNLCPSGTSYGAWDTSGCSPITVNCSPSSYTDTQACPSGFTGSQYRTVSNMCASGNSYGAWDTSGCVPVVVCSPSSIVDSQACPAGYTGSQTRTVTTECSGAITYGSWSGSCQPDIPATPSSVACDRYSVGTVVTDPSTSLSANYARFQWMTNFGYDSRGNPIPSGLICGDMGGGMGN